MRSLAMNGAPSFERHLFYSPLRSQPYSSHSARFVDDLVKSGGHIAANYVMSHIELTSHIALSLEAVMKSDRIGNLFQGWRVPCLRLTVVGKWHVFEALKSRQDQSPY